MSDNKEYRKLDNAIEFKENRTIEGYALVFNSTSELLDGWFYEIIDPNALDGVIEKSDVLALYNHDSYRGFLARSKFNDSNATLKLEIDSKGLKYTFDAPHTSLGDEVLEMIRLKNITASSFAFTIESDEKTKNSDGTYTRTITKIDRLFDISAVITPAYSSATVDCKRMLDFKLEEEKRYLEEKQIEEEKQKQIEEEKRHLDKIELENYYLGLEKMIVKKQ